MHNIAMIFYIQSKLCKMFPEIPDITYHVSLKET